MNTNCSETSAIFRIVGPNVEPVMVTEVLGIRPSFSLSKGDLPSRRARPSLVGIWALESDALISSDELEDHLGALLALLPSNVIDAVPPGARCEIKCTWRSATGHGGPTISSRTLAKIAGLGIDLDFDFYSDV